MKKKIYLLLLCISFLCLYKIDYAESKSRTYQQILNTGIRPKIKPDYPFPVSKQSAARCFAYAIKHIAYYKYKLEIDVPWAEKQIYKKPTSLWGPHHINDFLQLYKLELEYAWDAESFFKFLANGDPIVIQYMYGSIGHFVAVYSFDREGAWIAESVANKCMRIPYYKIFKKDGRETLFAFGRLNRTGIFKKEDLKPVDLSKIDPAKTEKKQLHELLIDILLSVHDKKINEDAAIKLMQSYIKYGANINRHTSRFLYDYEIPIRDNTPLHIAVFFGYYKIVRFLCENGAMVNSHSFYEEVTPLHVAAQKERWEILEYLISQKANVNDKERDSKMTPLHYAAMKGNRKVIKLLLEKGADASAKNSSGDSPLDIAIQNQQMDIAKLIAEKIPPEQLIVNFGDKNFETAVRKALRQEKGPISKLDLGKLEVLEAESLRIVHVDELKYMPNLVELYLRNNGISFISPIKKLSRLRLLDISSNRIDSLEYLKGLPHLRYLDASYNKLTRFDDLGPNKLFYFKADHNQIKTIQGIEEWNDIRFLSLQYNSLKYCNQFDEWLKQRKNFQGVMILLGHNPFNKWKKALGIITEQAEKFKQKGAVLHYQDDTTYQLAPIRKIKKLDTAQKE